MKITVYTSNDCKYCDLVKREFKDSGVDYTEKNITEDKSAKMELIAKGKMSVPITCVEENGKERDILGYNKKEIDKIVSKIKGM